MLRPLEMAHQFLAEVITKEDVVVDASQRGKKLGTQLIQQLIKKGESLGLGEILLFSSPDNVAAIKLYENEGFKHKGVEVLVKALKEIYPPES